jgi:hypothetical protein
MSIRDLLALGLERHLSSPSIAVWFMATREFAGR